MFHDKFATISINAHPDKKNLKDYGLTLSTCFCSTSCKQDVVEKKIVAPVEIHVIYFVVVFRQIYQLRLLSRELQCMVFKDNGS